MASYTKGMRKRMVEIHNKIVEAHRAGACDKDGNPIPSRIYGYGQLRLGLCPLGEQKLNVWPRDEQGKLIDD